MRKGPRLLLDILISAVFAIFSAVLGLLAGFVLFIMVGLVFFRGRSDDAVGVIGIFLMFLCGLIFGVAGFPLCGIWLDQRRQAARIRASLIQGS